MNDSYDFAPPSDGTKGEAPSPPADLHEVRREEEKVPSTRSSKFRRGDPRTIENARKGAEARWRRDAGKDAGGDRLDLSSGGSGLGLVERLEAERECGNVELSRVELRRIVLAGCRHADWVSLPDRELAGVALREILDDSRTSPGDRVAAAKALREIEERGEVRVELPDVSEIRSLSTLELDRLLRKLEAQEELPGTAALISVKGKKHPTPVRIQAAKALDWDARKTSSGSWRDGSAWQNGEPKSKAAIKIAQMTSSERQELLRLLAR